MKRFIKVSLSTVNYGLPWLALKIVRNSWIKNVLKKDGLSCQSPLSKRPWLNKFSKTRENDVDFASQIQCDTVHTCEKYFVTHAKNKILRYVSLTLRFQYSRWN